MKKSALKLTETDTAATAMEDIPAGEIVAITDTNGKDTEGIRALSDIKRGHKIALKDINLGEEVIKYGYPIGIACKSILRGECINTDNLVSARGRGDL